MTHPAYFLIAKMQKLNEISEMCMHSILDIVNKISFGRTVDEVLQAGHGLEWKANFAMEDSNDGKV